MRRTSAGVVGPPCVRADVPAVSAPTAANANRAAESRLVMESNYTENPAPRQPEPPGRIERAFPNAWRFVV